MERVDRNLRERKNLSWEFEGEKLGFGIEEYKENGNWHRLG